MDENKSEKAQEEQINSSSAPILKQTDNSNPFPEALFDDFKLRMEHPNPAKKWDKPLFYVKDGEEM